MRWISSKIHSIFDYVIGLLLLVAPGFVNVPSGVDMSWVLRVLGGLLIVYSVVTRYELGVFRRLPIVAHLVLDVLVGIALAASPWVFDYPQESIVPLFLIGLAFVASSLMTETDAGTADELTAVHLGVRDDTSLHSPGAVNPQLPEERDEDQRRRRAG